MIFEFLHCSFSFLILQKIQHIKYCSGSIYFHVHSWKIINYTRFYNMYVQIARWISDRKCSVWRLNIHFNLFVVLAKGVNNHAYWWKIKYFLIYFSYSVISLNLLDFLYAVEWMIQYWSQPRQTKIIGRHPSMIAIMRYSWPFIQQAIHHISLLSLTWHLQKNRKINHWCAHFHRYEMYYCLGRWTIFVGEHRCLLRCKGGSSIKSMAVRWRRSEQQQYVVPVSFTTLQRTPQFRMQNIQLVWK